MHITRTIDEDNDRTNAFLDQISLWKRRALAAEFEATHDGMTGVLNRKGFYEHAAKNKYQYVYVIDVDGLKHVNDSQGHKAGDDLIKYVVDQLKALALVGDGIVARVGGDEFVILTNKLAVTGPTAGFSHGWANIDYHTSIDDALHKADERMYVRKVQRRATPSSAVAAAFTATS